jgi:hypothetical protein
MLPGYRFNILTAKEPHSHSDNPQEYIYLKAISGTLSKRQ